jgi:hypothetical protein
MTFTIPADIAGWIALLSAVLPLLSQLITALIIRRNPQLKSRQRFSLSVVVSFVLMMGPGWGLLVGLGYSKFDLPAFLLMIPSAVAVSGGKEIVYRVAQDLWKSITDVPPPPSESDGNWTPDVVNPPKVAKATEGLAPKHQRVVDDVEHEIELRRQIKDS